MTRFLLACKNPLVPAIKAVKHKGAPGVALCRQTIDLKLERADLAAVARSPVSTIDQADQQPECRAKCQLWPEDVREHDSGVVPLKCHVRLTT